MILNHFKPSGVSRVLQCQHVAKRCGIQNCHWVKQCTQYAASTQQHKFHANLKAREEQSKKNVSTFGVQAKSHEKAYMESYDVKLPEVKVITDEPKALGGTGNGPTPLALSIMSLCGCEVATARSMAKKLKMNIGEIEFEKAEGELDVRGLRGTNPEVPKHFNRLNVIVNVECHDEESAQKLEQLKEYTESNCPVNQLFVSAGVEINSEWRRK